jgi:hypothetical protein
MALLLWHVWHLPITINILLQYDTLALWPFHMKCSVCWECWKSYSFLGTSI